MVLIRKKKLNTIEKAPILKIQRWKFSGPVSCWTLQVRTPKPSIIFYPSFLHSIVTNTDGQNKKRTGQATFKQHLF